MGKRWICNWWTGKSASSARKQKQYDLDKMLESVPDDFESEDWGLGPPVGNEVW